MFANKVLHFHKAYHLLSVSLFCSTEQTIHVDLYYRLGYHPLLISNVRPRSQRRSPITLITIIYNHRKLHEVILRLPTWVVDLYFTLGMQTRKHLCQPYVTGFIDTRVQVPFTQIILAILIKHGLNNSIQCCTALRHQSIFCGLSSSRPSVFCFP